MDIQLKRGLLDVCVLAAIKDEDSYGYQIIKDIHPYVEISESTLYPILRRMENAGLPEGSDRQDGMLCMHGLCMNPQTLKVTLNNEPLDLTSMEFQLLYHLARGAGRIFSREDLLNLFAEKEWNKFDRCVDVHISSLRKKLGDNSRCPTYLKTVRGLGYMFIKQSDAWP